MQWDTVHLEKPQAMWKPVHKGNMRGLNTPEITEKEARGNEHNPLPEFPLKEFAGGPRGARGIPARMWKPEKLSGKHGQGDLEMQAAEKCKQLPWAQADTTRGGSSERENSIAANSSDQLFLRSKDGKWTSSEQHPHFSGEIQDFG